LRKYVQRNTITYYRVPCAQAFPEMALVAQQLALQHALGRFARVCRVPGRIVRREVSK